MRFKRGRRVLECGAFADVDRRGDGAATGERGERGVDGVGGEELIGFEVGGGETDGAPAAVATLDGGVEFVRTAEDDGGVSDATVCQEPAGHGAAGADDRMIVERCGDGLDDVGLKAEAGREPLQELHVAGAFVTEAEIRPFDDRTHSVISHDAREEGGGVQRQEVGRRREADDFVCAGFAEESLTLVPSGETRGHAFGAQGGERVRVKAEGDDALDAAGIGDVSRGADEGGVPEMDAVKNADGCDTGEHKRRRVDGRRGHAGAIPCG